MRQRSTPLTLPGPFTVANDGKGRPATTANRRKTTADVARRRKRSRSTTAHKLEAHLNATVERTRCEHPLPELAASPRQRRQGFRYSRRSIESRNRYRR